MLPLFSPEPFIKVMIVEKVMKIKVKIVTNEVGNFFGILILACISITLLSSSLLVFMSFLQHSVCVFSLSMFFSETEIDQHLLYGTLLCEMPTTDCLFFTAVCLLIAERIPWSCLCVSVHVFHSLMQNKNKNCQRMAGKNWNQVSLFMNMTMTTLFFLQLLFAFSFASLRLKRGSDCHEMAGIVINCRGYEIVVESCPKGIDEITVGTSGGTVTVIGCEGVVLRFTQGCPLLLYPGEIREIFPPECRQVNENIIDFLFSKLS